MAKDPAFLFYHHDFIVGTALMTMEEVGQYTTILCHLADKGSLSLEEIEIIVRGEVSEKVLGKLACKTSGRYFNRRLEEEVNKRKEYAKSRRNNRLSKNKVVTHEKHMSTHMVNVNRDVNVNRNKDNIVFKTPTKSEVKAYCEERNNGVNATKFVDFYEAKGWMVGKNKMKNWQACVRTWETKGENHENKRWM